MFDFKDGKDPAALRTIGEVAAALSIRQHVLRYWEEQFPMLRPIKRSGGRRYYRPEDVRLVSQIDRLVHGDGYTLRGARQAIEAGMGGEGTAMALQHPVSVAAAAEPVRTGSDDLIVQLRSLRATLAGALAGS
jgi:DNA-binding transcriptional MerR regulator